VRISNTPTCTCPDHVTRGNRCKHIYFVLGKVMGVANLDKRRYTNEDVRFMCENIPSVLAHVYATRDILDRYHSLVDKAPCDKTHITQKGLDDVCPICLCDMVRDGDEEIDFCRIGCGRSVHAVCFTQWCSQNTEKTCVFCRAKWSNPADATTGAKTTDDARHAYNHGTYVNLARSVTASATY
jgi:hypothetical protein